MMLNDCLWRFTNAPTRSPGCTHLGSDPAASPLDVSYSRTLAARSGGLENEATHSCKRAEDLHFRVIEELARLLTNCRIERFL